MVLCIFILVTTPGGGAWGGSSWSGPIEKEAMGSPERLGSRGPLTRVPRKLSFQYQLCQVASALPRVGV